MLEKRSITWMSWSKAPGSSSRRNKRSSDMPRRSSETSDQHPRNSSSTTHRQRQSYRPSKATETATSSAETTISLNKCTKSYFNSTKVLMIRLELGKASAVGSKNVLPRNMNKSRSTRNSQSSSKRN